jgi:hypothetical protein
MKKAIFFLFLPLLFLLACKNGGTEIKTPGDTAVTDASYVTKKVSDIEPYLQNADSLQVLYYNNPDDDSLRYTRYFTYTETRDTTLIKSLVNELNQVYVQEPKTRSCRSEGKFYLLKGEDILKTIYFSTRGDSCSYFYFIKDGLFTYFPMTEVAKNLLKEKKQLARKPAAGS